MINSRAIDDLKPHVALICRKFIEVCQLSGAPVLITSTFRDSESQDAIYAQGRTTLGKIVTNCKGGESMHQYRVAFDFVPVDVKGAPVWDDLSLWETCGNVAAKLGIEWGGSWKRFKDRPHCQVTGGKTIKQLSNELT